MQKKKKKESPAVTAKKQHKHIFTSESVTEAHPDKVCDQISDAVLDEVLKQDPKGRVACEVLASTNLIVIAGEITTKAKIDPEKIARDVLKEVGYTNAEWGIDYKTCKVLNFLKPQSPDIAQSVLKKHDDPYECIGAGDQGCIKKGTLIKTEKGFLPIEKVKLGDFVSTPFGLKKVLKSKKTGVKKVVEIKFSNGMRLECTPGHKVLCYNREGKTYWRKAFSLTKKDFVCTLKVKNVFSNKYLKSYIPRQKFFSKYNHKIYGPEEVILDKELGYTIGLLIGDGYVKKENSMEIAFGRNKKFALLVKKILNKKFPNQWRIIETKDEMINLKIDSLLVRKHFENFGVYYNKAARKVTPSAIFISPPDVIKAHLKGLFDSDGTIVIDTGRNKNNIRIRLGSSSYQLLQETQLLLNEFNIKSSILFNCPKGTPVGKNKKYKAIYDNYVLNLVGFESYQNFGREIGFFNPQKNKRIKRYLEVNKVKPRNSRSLFLIPHPHKDEMIGEELLDKNLPFGIATIKGKTIKSAAEVYDLEVSKVNIFSANGIFVHNSMFGFACKETPEFMPMPIAIAQRITKRLTEARKSKEIPWLRPDGKCQVSVEYLNNKPHRIDTIVVSTQHDDKVAHKEIEKEIKEKVILPVLPEGLKDEIRYFINPSGRFVCGGPQADAGLTGRKQMVDTYGGYARQGGGAFSGKDPTKVDRSGAYIARFVAKNLVANGLAGTAEVQIAYAIGVSRPVSILVETFGTSKLEENELIEIIKDNFDLRPAAIIEKLNLRKPIYQKVAAYGHFGRNDLKLPWEKIIKLKLPKDIKTS